MVITKSLRTHLETNHGLPAGASDREVKQATLKAVGDKKLSPRQLAELTSDSAAAEERKAKMPEGLTGTDAGNPDPKDVFAGATKESGGMDFNGKARVKKPSECYKQTRNNCKWPDNREVKRKGDFAPGLDAFQVQTVEGTGQEIRHPITEPSEAEYAKIGAFFKHMVIRDCGEDATRVLPWLKMTEHDKQLVQEAMHEDTWVGPAQKNGPEGPRKLEGIERKNVESMMLKAPVLGDTSGASGGEQAVPQYFDFEAIRIPLLFGELVPYVEITPTDRGKAAHSYSIGTPTFVTTASGSAISAFDATSFVSAYDATFFPASCGFNWGRDFEADAAPQFGQLVVAQLGDQFKLQMDNWIAVGDGTTQPQGLNSASSTITVSATGSSHATMVYNDAVNLAFGVTKPYRKAFGGQSTMYVTSDKEYKKFMQVVTGVTGDARPIFGMHLKDYQLGDYHVAVQNDIADGTAFFANLRGYRLYRRLGLYFELLTSGQTLTLSNLKLLFARARFGGKLTLGGYCAKMTSLQIG